MSEHHPASLSSDPRRGIAIVRDAETFKVAIVDIPIGYEIAIAAIEQIYAPTDTPPLAHINYLFDHMRGRSEVLLFDGGDVVWLKAMQKMLNEANAKIVKLPPKIRTLTIGELLALKIPPREHILEPWLPTQGLAMLYAPRGIGKTYTALGIAYAVACGDTFWKWKATVPRRVLYLDGEMPLSAMQERIEGIVNSSKIEPPAPDYFRLVNPDLLESSINLSSPESQAGIEPLLDGVELVVVDNLSTLGSFGRENESESWLPLQEWALGLRKQGKSVLFIHHAGKGGNQRGTSRREDVLDTVIALKRPTDYDPQEGAHFEVHFEKSRNFTGDEAAPFDVKLTPLGWTLKDLSDTRDERIRNLAAEGLKQRDIAMEIGVSLGTVNRVLKKGAV